MRNIIIAVLLAIIYSCAPAIKQPITSGAFSIFVYSPDSLTDPIFGRWYERLVWYDDSAVIIQEKLRDGDGGLKITGEPFDPETEKFEFYRFVDLRTMYGQDYFVMEPDAPPICSFYIPKLKGVLNYRDLESRGAFKEVKNGTPSRPYNEYKFLKDTIISDIKNKRIEFSYFPEGYKIIYYLKEGATYPPFLQVKMPTIKIRDIRRYSVWSSESSRFGKMNLEDSYPRYRSGALFLNENLDENTKSVFTTWRKNLLEIHEQPAEYKDPFRPCNTFFELERKYNPEAWKGWKGEMIQGPELEE